jgi:O-antigen ligase
LQLSTPQLPGSHFIHPVFAFFACAAILLPAHPSLQAVFLAYGVPSSAVSAVFTLPLLYLSVKRRLLTRRSFSILLLFLAYVCWMVGRGIFSPAFGEPNFLASIRGIVILVPLVLLCALVAAKNQKCAAQIIFLFGFIAIAHFCVLALLGGTFSESAGFRSLSSDLEAQNYQSTSFYFGFVGVFTACMALRYRGSPALFGIVGTIVVVALMGAVGARASLAALTASVFAIITISDLGRMVRVLSLAFLIFIVVAILAWGVGILDIEAFRSQLVVIDRFVELFDEDDSSQRVRLFSSALAMWLDSPTSFLVGGGLSAFPAFIGESKEEGWYPHNFVLESLAEGGLVAGLILLPIGLRLLYEFVKLKSKRADIGNIYLGALALYAVAAFQVMGGVQTLWIPTFFVALFLFGNSQGRA